MKEQYLYLRLLALFLVGLVVTLVLVVKAQHLDQIYQDDTDFSVKLDN